ncbi:MAG: MlaD family protein [Planctomycetota bacterium]|nr:MlaD family protein [Planctomycetota bacterium]
MNDKKHIVVGLFVLVGAIILGTMIIWFEGVAIFIRGGYVVNVHLDSAVGIRAGKRVHLDGIEVGEVVNVTSAEPERRGVWLELQINSAAKIPASARFVAQQSATGGDAFMDFRTVSPTKEFLRPTEKARIEGEIIPPTLLPPDLVANFNDLIMPRTLAELRPANPPTSRRPSPRCNSRRWPYRTSSSSPKAVSAFSWARRPPAPRNSPRP